MLLRRTGTSELYVRDDGSILKRSGALAPPGDPLGRREVDFYRFARQRPDLALPIPTCFEATYEGDAGRLAFESLRPAKHARVSDRDALRLVVDALARVHAAFWGTAPGPWAGALPLAHFTCPNAATLRTYLERACWQLPRVLSDEDALTIGDIIESGVIDALARPTHRTLTHADVHLGNALFRIRGGSVEAVLIDWQRYEVGIGPVDLAHLLLGLEPAERRAAQYTLVRRYHEELTAAGVRGYPLEACLRDYRLGVAREILVGLARAEGVLDSADLESRIAAYRELSLNPT